jgi:hypothetical protein
MSASVSRSRAALGGPRTKANPQLLELPTSRQPCVLGESSDRRAELIVISLPQCLGCGTRFPDRTFAAFDVDIPVALAVPRESLLPVRQP